MDLVEIMGKKNRKVPVLLTPSIREALDLLNHTRNDVGISESNPYVFAKGDENYIRGSEALNAVLDMVPDLQFPENIRFPKMRKYLATVVQIYGLSEIELQEVARHLGHELSVHRQYYRLQDDVIELAKISKLLLAVEAGQAHQFAGKSIDDIDIESLPDITDNLEARNVVGSLAESQLPAEPIESDLENTDETPQVLPLRESNKRKLEDCYEFDKDYYLDDTVKDPDYRRDKEMTDSDTSDGERRKSGNAERKRQKISTSKKKWTEFEKLALQPLVSLAVKEKKPPKKREIQLLKRRTDLFQDMNWINLKHQVWALAQSKLKQNQTLNVQAKPSLKL